MKIAPPAAGDLAGLPYYLSDQIPDGLDHEAGLRQRHRRLLTTGQPAVAVQRNRGPGRRWIPLYQVTDATPMPPLSPARQATWDAIRTCAWCSQIRLDPCQVNTRGERICGRAECWAARSRRDEAGPDNPPYLLAAGDSPTQIPSSTYTLPFEHGAPSRGTAWGAS